MRDAAVLKSLILRTFSNAPFPKGIRPAEHQCGECDKIREAFARKVPFALADSVIEHHQDSLPLLSPAAFHHFLPAYLVYAIDHPDSVVAQFAWFSLSPDELDEFYVERFGRFSESERSAVREVVEFIIEQNSEVEISPEERARARDYWRVA